MAARTTDSIDNICTICHEDEAVHSVSECNHHICFKCSTRLRILHKQYECPICRTVSKKVLFVRKVHHYQSYDTKTFLWDSLGKILFEDKGIKDLHKDLIAHRCSRCADDVIFKNFKLLQDHNRKQHQLFFCEICIHHIKLFSNERKLYSRADLATHKRKGDSDDKSFKGHPLCEICDNRFLDTDELWRHLRKDHFFCHFCDADGEHIYFGNYADVKVHFRDEHFLCEEDQCADVQFTNAFRSEMDLKAHKATEHLKNAKRSFQKQARTIDIDFNYGESRRTAGEMKRGKEDRKKRTGAGSNITADDYLEVHTTKSGNHVAVREESETARAISASLRENLLPAEEPPPPAVYTEDFPTLGGVTASVPVRHESPTQQRKPMRSGITMHDDDEPGEAYPSLLTSNRAPAPAAAKLNPVRENVAPVKTKSNPWNSAEEEFPSLGNAKAPVHGWHIPKPEPKPKMTFVTNARPKVNSTHEFPSLGGPSPSLAGIGSWVKQTSGSGRRKVAEPPEKAMSSTLAADANMPTTLQESEKTKKKKKSKSKQMEESIPERSQSNRFVEELDEKTKKNKNHSNADSPSMSRKTTQLGSKKNPKVQPETDSLIASLTVDLDDYPVSTLELPNKLAPGPEITKSVPKPTAGKPNIAEDSDFPSLGPAAGPSRLPWKAQPPGLNRKNNSEYPELQSSKPTKATTKAPPGLGGLPPGLGNESKKTPPGLSKSTVNGNASVIMSTPNTASLNSIANLLSDESKPAQYVEPVNFMQRNKKLAFKLKELIANDVEKFHKFKNLSMDYRSGQLTADHFHDLCSNLLGSRVLSTILPELVVLLPDIQKQQALYKYIQSNMPKSGWQTSYDIFVCPKCRQVLMEQDRLHHAGNHGSGDYEDFPTVGAIN